MIVGKSYRVSHIVADGLKGVKSKSWAECIWVHPKGRFCVLRFKDGWNECFFPGELGAR